jgi:hypothetical protein
MVFHISFVIWKFAAFGHEPLLEIEQSLVGGNSKQHENGVVRCVLHLLLKGPQSRHRFHHHLQELTLKYLIVPEDPLLGEKVLNLETHAAIVEGKEVRILIDRSSQVTDVRQCGLFQQCHDRSLIGLDAVQTERVF